MAEPLPTQEKAQLYILGELSPRERAAFEASAAASSELASTVRQLEEGAVALAMAASPNVPPHFVWTKIEDAINEEARASRVISIFFGTVRNGWAAAAVILIGWMIHALYLSRPLHSTPERETVSVAAADAISPAALIPHESNPAAKSPVMHDRETTILSNQLVGLQRQVMHLSRSVTQQQSMLNDASRIKFHNLVSANAAQSSVAQTLTPALQRALFLAMARELGWISSTNDIANPQSSGTLNVEFVDFRSEHAKGNSLNQEKEKQTESLTQQKEFASATSASPLPAVIPAFVSGENLVVAIDTSIAPAGSQVAFLSGGTGQPLGTALIGDHPIVVTFSNSDILDGLLLQTTTSTGQSSVIGLNPTSP